MLELGLPAPARELADRSVADIGPDDAELDLAGLDHTHIDHTGLDHTGLGRAEPEAADPEAAESAGAEPERAEPERAEPERAEASHAEADIAELDYPAAGDATPAASELTARGIPAPDFQPRPMPTLGSSRGSTADDVLTPFPAQNGDVNGPARSERGNPYADGSNGSTTPGGPADLVLGRWQGTPPARMSGLEGLTAGGGNGHSRGNGHGNGQHQGASQPEPGRLDPGQRDAARRDTVQHRIIEPGAPRHDTGPRHETGRHDTGRHDSGPRHGPRPETNKLDSGVGPAAADLRTLVDRTLASCRAAEGRNMFGGYGNSGLTPAMQRIAAHLPGGGLARGSEADSLKSPDRFAAKLARLIARNPGRTAEELAAAIGDAVRYAFVFEAGDYVEGTWLVHRRLKSHGFELEIRRNRWESPEYKGIFTQWRDPAHHIAFEVQFHTSASWAVAQRTHDAYVRITDPATRPAERARLRARQVAAAATAKPPPNWADIADFRLDPR
jgi:hypothetical protein